MIVMNHELGVTEMRMLKLQGERNFQWDVLLESYGGT